MTPLDLAVVWVRAGGRQGAERDNLLDATERRGGYLCPSGRVHTSVAHALKLWKAKAHRTIKSPPRGAPAAPRVPRTVLVTERIASALDRGETVTITGATLVTP